MMIEVFSTNVDDAENANMLISMIADHFPACNINFDLDDCDKILRVEGNDFRPAKIVSLVKQNGFHCSILD